MGDNKVLRENVKEVVGEHLFQHGNYRCPQCRGIILEDWIKGVKLTCPKCFAVVTQGMLSLERPEDKAVWECMNDLVNTITTYLLRDKPI